MLLAAKIFLESLQFCRHSTYQENLNKFKYTIDENNIEDNTIEPKIVPRMKAIINNKINALAGAGCGAPYQKKKKVS